MRPNYRGTRELLFWAVMGGGRGMLWFDFKAEILLLCCCARPLPMVAYQAPVTARAQQTLRVIAQVI